MSNLSQQELDAVRAALEAQRAGLLQQIRAAMADSDSHQFQAVLGQGSGDSSDEALASSLADFSAAQIDHKVQQFQALEAAAARLNSDDFGLCPDCDALIPLPRLLANPAAVRCVGCQTVYERTHAGSAHGSL